MHQHDYADLRKDGCADANEIVRRDVRATKGAVCDRELCDATEGLQVRDSILRFKQWVLPEAVLCDLDIRRWW